MLTAMRMMDTLKARLAAHFQLTTDGFVPYIGAVDHAWALARHALVTLSTS